MKKFIQLIFGIIILPLLLMGVFSGINGILSVTFNQDFWIIQNSPIWVIWFMISIVIIVYYFTEVAD